MSRGVQWRSWLSALLGAWFVVAPWVLRFTHEGDATWVSVLVGGILLASSIWQTSAGANPRLHTWLLWVNVVCGFWFVVHPFLGHFEEGPYYAIAAPGVLTIVVNLWSLMAPAWARHSTRD